MSYHKNPADKKAHSEWRATGISLLQKIISQDDRYLSGAIAQRALDKYYVPAKPLQIQTVVNLVRGRNVMLLAGTGFGKSRIPEMFHSLINKKCKGVVLVLNPLDVLGHNQVLEKQRAGFTAINLTKLTFNPTVAANIQQGMYNFVYLSPEIYLNSKLFSRVYFSAEFQSRLALVVVDEAHLIYHWGMVKSTRGRKRASALGRHKDRGVFRPSYGNLGRHLLARNGVPILLMSATCPPVAIRAIQRNLKLDSSSLVLLRGELTRPEIRMIRVVMKSSLTSCADLVDLYSPISVTPNEKAVPSLIYCNTRRKTGQVLEVLAKARGTPEDAANPRSTFARRYHSCTGDNDKEDVAKDFGEGRLAVVLCTMALGLGQNWTRVRSVVHLGRGDPSAVCRMVGRCGRDGQPGLAIMYVEKNRINGKNHVSQFRPGVTQTDDDRMDALAITPDEGYLAEKAREEKEGFPTCRCSNCLPAQAALLIDCMPSMTIDNINEMILIDIASDSPWIHKKVPLTRQRTTYTPMDNSNSAVFRAQLLTEGTSWIAGKLSERSFILPEDIFSNIEVDSIMAKLEGLETEEHVRVAVGGHYVEGLVTLLHKLIIKFKCGALYQEHLAKVRSDEEDRYVKKTPLKHLNNNQKKRKAKLQVIAAANKAKKTTLGPTEKTNHSC
ncbi:hypothetical protein MJO29_006917 [Puccinia striiformis f. sp. tritici]|uniref:DNA 3'-5' helicase n=1 Tax=Puccinia striiformis TaxID=27350 RepID=A0A2S4W8M1_9BASI|nr:hypothetical protein MJO29_006917 [Puccinia striiformis f. sp. tritici]POW18096.1 hypothetical protein PSHT_06191 [Puccinia striiformis]